MIHRVILSVALFSPQGFDFTIQSTSSTVNLVGTTTTGVSGELVGDWDATGNPGGTQTRPGIFGGSGNMPVSCDFDVELALSTVGIPDGTFHFDIDTASLTLDVSELQLSPFGSAGTSVGLTLILDFETFRTFNPDSLFIGGIPLPIPLGSASLTDALFVQAAPSLPGVLTPDPLIADRYTFTAMVPTEFNANVDLFGTLLPVGPIPFAYALSGTLDITPSSATASLLASQNVSQNTPNPSPGSFGPLPFQLPTILPPGSMASLLFTGTISGLDLVLDVNVDILANGTPAGCDAEVYCTAAANSVGPGANISSTGSTSVSANDLVLHAGPVPNQPAIFFFGPNQIEVPFGNGFRCVGGAVKRLPVVFASGNAIVYAVDNTLSPSAGFIVAGSTWNFQAWSHDPAAGGANFNLSDAIRIDFCR